MYHYISRFPGAISVSPDCFEAQCRSMKQNGWHGIGLDEAEAFLRDGTPLPPRSVLITFDDGYLDNYVYAWPILRRYGHKGVVFAVTERLESSHLLRPTLEDVWKGMPAGSLPPVDSPMQETASGFSERRDLFFSWEEARRMEADGVMSIAAHSARHLAVFAGPEWGPVNRHDRHKTASSELEALGQRFHIPGTRMNTFNKVDFPIVWGLPRFKERPFLYSRAFLPSSELIDAVRRLVPQDPVQARAFFQSADNVRHLETLTDSFADRLGTWESEEDQCMRVRDELTRCAETLRHELGHPVHSLCWPWGSGSSIALEEGKKAGFSVFFTTKMGANPPAEPGHVHRFKVRNASWSWLRLRLEIYARPWLAALYASCRI